jgi:hypothetical protein
MIDGSVLARPAVTACFTLPLPFLYACDAWWEKRKARKLPTWGVGGLSFGIQITRLNISIGVYLKISGIQMPRHHNWRLLVAALPYFIFLAVVLIRNKRRHRIESDWGER